MTPSFHYCLRLPNVSSNDVPPHFPRLPLSVMAVNFSETHPALSTRHHHGNSRAFSHTEAAAVTHWLIHVLLSILSVPPPPACVFLYSAGLHVLGRFRKTQQNTFFMTFRPQVFPCDGVDKSASFISVKCFFVMEYAVCSVPR